MNCPYCRSQINDGLQVCPICKADLRRFYNNQMSPNQGQQPIEQNINQGNQQFNNNNVNNTGNKKSNNGLVIAMVIVGISLAVIIGLVFLGIKLIKNGIKGISDSISDNIINYVEEVEDEDEYDALGQLKHDYDSGIIDVNEYFTQLTYFEYDSSKISQKYSLKEREYIAGDLEDIDEILEEHFDELDEDIVKFYLKNKLLGNVKFKGEETKTSSNVKKISNNDEEADDLGDNAYDHYLNKVKLSSNGHFLIWYTNIGPDAISEELVDNISQTLETSVNKYEEYTGIEYKYKPYVDNIFGNDRKDHEFFMEMEGIPVSTLNTAMSVYVYETGSEDVVAYYSDEEVIKKILNRAFSVLQDVGLDVDGFINYPNIVINRKNVIDDQESAKQIVNHELFHHMQHLYCIKTNQKDPLAGKELTEAMANVASAKVSESTSYYIFLNNWAGRFKKQTSKGLAEIRGATGAVGYGAFPYFYIYSEKLGPKILLDAHNSTNAYKYIVENTSTEDLVDVINEVAYHNMCQDYDNKALISNVELPFKNRVKFREKGEADSYYNETINPGAIDYFELDSNMSFKITNEQIDNYLTIKLYGYKNNEYTELESSNQKIERTLNQLFEYDKFYLVITNANLVETGNYELEINYLNGENIEENYADNSDYDTSFKNYNVEIKMNVSAGGFEVNSTSKGVIDELHQKQYLVTETPTMGFSVTTKTYTDFATGYTYTEIPYGNSWQKDKSTTQMIDLKMILKKLTSMENVTKNSDGSYNIKMTKNEIKGLMSDQGDASKITGDVYINVYTSNGYITKLEYDFSNIMPGIEKFSATINFSNYNNAGDVEIPQSVIDNATN